MTLAAVTPAWAAGGAHVVDDAAVEAPGVCHLESWLTRYGAGHGLLDASPACTRAAWPRLELGAGLQHTWDRVSDTTVGPALKLSVRPIEGGWGVGVAAAGAWTLRSGRLETASLIVPVTLLVGERARLNVNAGWTHARASADRDAAFVGAQLEIQVVRQVGLMAETFRRDHARAGAQLGVRWTPGDGPVDIDLLAGRRIDGASPKAITLGLTVRR